MCDLTGHFLWGATHFKSISNMLIVGIVRKKEQVTVCENLFLDSFHTSCLENPDLFAI